jgi:hypothetical protein
MSFEPCPGVDTQEPIPLRLICQSGHHAPLRRLNCSSTTRVPDFVFDMSEEHKAGVWDLLPEPWPDSGNDLSRKPPRVHAQGHAHLDAMTGEERLLSVLRFNLPPLPKI